MKKTFLVLSALFLFLRAGAQQLNPVKLQFRSERISQTEAVIFITAQIEKGWQIYSLDMMEGGAVKTSILFKPSKTYEPIEETLEPTPVWTYDDPYGIQMGYFTDSVTFVQRIAVKSGKTLVEGTIEYMASNDSLCLAPEQVDFAIPVDQWSQR